MAKVAPPKSPGKWWSTKRYILAGLAVVLAVVAVVSVFSIVLSPGEIHFSIISQASNSDPDGRHPLIELNLTLAANNTSHRTGVRYRSFLVYYLQYAASSTEKVKYSTPAKVIRAPPISQQPPLSTAEVEVSASLSMDEPAMSGGRRSNNNNIISVLLVSVVQFKAGPAYWLPYQVRVQCNPIDSLFSGSLATPINCTS
ncbi:hypothetical protein BRADI_1g50690v3 [Brachypodium distachyon]|uniref:Late embryogenesis abundant protein LEA-2 subgroup domain-containing protein n=1 Tax=Brachypodium distachyon TaxID=15368 RepID=I1H1I2_BRADI|nr:hypothetical protein BRADI_1g50690v3 [Brachypodium distachyon]